MFPYIVCLYIPHAPFWTNINTLSAARERTMSPTGLFIEYLLLLHYVSLSTGMLSFVGLITSFILNSLPSGSLARQRWNRGRVKLLSAVSSAAVLFNGIKESWRLARKILSQFKLLWFLNVFFVTHYSPFSTWKEQKNLFFAAGSTEQLNPPQISG